MKKLTMTKEEAERLGRRDRNRLIGLGVLTVLVAGMYLYSAGNARKKADAEALAASQEIASASDVEDIVVIPFENKSVLEEIKDGTPTEQEFIEGDPLASVFEYARIQTAGSFEGMGIVEADSNVLAPIIEDPSSHRLDALRVRGTIIAVTERPRANSISKDWTGSMELADGGVVHFQVAGAPVQSDGKRGIELGDYLRVDGLFHAMHRKTVTRGEGPATVAGPLILGPRAEASTPEISEEIARLMPSLQSVQDDTIGAVFDSEVFQVAQWELMGHARLVGDTVDWEAVPELQKETLSALYEDGAKYRGMPFRFPVSINLDTFSRRAEDNPLRIDRYTEGWIGNNRWKDPVPAVRWIGPFERRDLMREGFNDDHRYVLAKGYFFRNHVFESNNGQPGKAPIFVLHDLDVFTPEQDASLTYFTYGVFGLTILLTLAIAMLLRADRRKSAKLYEDMIQRKRARRDRATAASTA